MELRRARASAPHRERRRRRLSRGIYLLPSVFTMGNIVLGFYAVVRGLGGDFRRAALAIFGAAVLDSLDGRIARLTGTESEFGKEFDSLADVLTFGLAPALLAYLWGLDELGRAGWLIPLFFIVCAAVRLARFNVQTRKVDSRYFVGLASPAAAGSVASLLLLVPDADWRAWLEAAMALALVLLGALMVSTFRYPSFKRLDLRRKVSYRVALPVAGLMLLIAYHPPAFFAAAALLYSASGPLSWVGTRLVRADRPAATSREEPEQPT